MSENTLNLIKENEVRWVDLRFTDTRGKEQHARYYLCTRLHFEYIGNTGRIAQDIHHLRRGCGILQRGFDLQFVPAFLHHYTGIYIPQYGTHVLRQLSDKAAPDRFTLDGDFGEILDNKFHRGDNGRV